MALFTYIARKRSTGEFFTGSIFEGKKNQPIMCLKLENAMHRPTKHALKQVLETQVGGLAKNFDIVKVRHELSIEED